MESEYSRESRVSSDSSLENPAPPVDSPSSKGVSAMHGTEPVIEPPAAAPPIETIPAPVAETPVVPPSTEASLPASTETPPLPRPDNPETLEVSQTKEATPGRDDGLSSAQNDTTDVTAAGRRRIQETLNLTADAETPSEIVTPSTAALSSKGMSAMQGAYDDPAGETTNPSTDLPPVSPSLPSSEPSETGLTPEQHLEMKTAQSAGTSDVAPAKFTFPENTAQDIPVSPSIPENNLNSERGYKRQLDMQNIQPPSPPSPPEYPGTFKTDYITDDLDGAANEINVENRDINKANRELWETHQWAQNLKAETGLTPEQYLQMKAAQSAGVSDVTPADFTLPGNTAQDIPVSPPLPQLTPTDAASSNLNLTPVSPELPITPATASLNIDASSVNPPIEKMTLPDGREALISGSPEQFKIFNHQQGDNQSGFEGTCGLVSCEDVARQFGKNVTENDVVNYAIDHNACEINSNDLGMNGGTTPEQQAQILSGMGIPTQALQLNSLDNLAEYVDEGRGVILETNAGVLWNNADYLQSGQINHAVVATGVARDPSSNALLGFFINDSGTNESCKFIPLSKMERSWLQRGGWAVITNQASANK